MNKKLSTALKVLSTAALCSAFAFSPVAHAKEKTSDVKTSIHTKVVSPQTATPIKHVVVIFGENVSFDHYFGTYPYALNPKGEPQFSAKTHTPEVNNLLTPKDYNGTQPGISSMNLITHNPNLANPVRIDRSEPITDDMDHGYHDEIAGTDGGKMDMAVQKTAGTGWPFPDGPANMVMNYYDGNTVTGLWNYAQNFAMNDNSFGTTYGPSTPGAVNLVAGDTTGASAYTGNSTTANRPGTSGAVENGVDIGDQDPFYDQASNGGKATGTTIKFNNSNKNVGDLLNAKKITWGWFQGGFANPTAQHKNVGGSLVTDYSPHHEPFQYYQSTANPNHLAPSSVDRIGKTDQANHQYDLTNFWQAVDNGNMPSVSYLKAPMYQDGHAGYSDPLDEQKFIVDTINKLEKTSEWSSTAVVLAYDDSDGWYDHVFGPSNGKSESTGQMGNGPRLPLMVVSPYAKQNYVDHTLTNQSSVLKFIEDNWKLGRLGGNSFDAQAGSMMNMFDFSKHAKLAPKVFLNDQTGEVTKVQPVRSEGEPKGHDQKHK